MSTHEHLQQQESANEAAEGSSHPFRDLNVTSHARQVDWLFLHRWLEGTNPCKKPQTQPAGERPGTGAAQ